MPTRRSLNWSINCSLAALLAKDPPRRRNPCPRGRDSGVGFGVAQAANRCAPGPMRRLFAFLAICLTLSGCANVRAQPAANVPVSAVSHKLVLRIQVLDTKYTGVEPDTPCPEDMQCIQMYGWIKYRARVREVISGDWREAEVTFLVLQHATYVDQFTRDCYVLLDDANDNLRTKTGIALVGTKILSNFNKSHRPKIEVLREGR